MKKNKRHIVLLAGAVIIFIACSKTRGGNTHDDDHRIDENDTSFPVLTVDKPTASQVFISGDTIKVEGKVTDNSLYNGKIKIINDANGLLMDEKTYETHYFTSYNFSHAYKTSVTASADYTITVEFEDHGLNKTLKTVKVKVNP